MLLPALLLVLAPTLLPAATAPAPVSLVQCGPTCSRLIEATAPGPGVGVQPASGAGDEGQALAPDRHGSVAAGALPTIRVVTGVTWLADPVTAPAQAPETTSPGPSEQPAAGNPSGTGLERWQATIVAVVLAGAIVWLAGRLRRMGRKG